MQITEIPYNSSSTVTVKNDSFGIDEIKEYHKTISERKSTNRLLTSKKV